MSKLILVFKGLGLVLAFLIIAWVMCMFGAAMLIEWAGDIKRKHAYTAPIK